MATSSNPENEAEINPSTTDGGYDTFEQPLAGEPEFIPPGAEQSANVEGTAALGTKLISFGCALRWQHPLSDAESADLQRDLAAVLQKYDAPDLPYVEEVALMANIGGIVIRRVVNENAAAAAAASPAQNPPQPPSEKEPPGNDIFGTREKGQRQNSPNPQAGFSRPAGEAGDLLS